MKKLFTGIFIVFTLVSGCKKAENSCCTPQGYPNAVTKCFTKKADREAFVKEQQAQGITAICIYK